MKPGTKTILKYAALMAILAVAVLGYMIAGFIHVSTFAPDPGVGSYQALKAQGVPMTGAARITNPTDHICVIGEVVEWTLPSGPPAYLFDPTGNLVDYTLDIGEVGANSVFQNFSGTNMTMAAVEAQFKRAQSNISPKSTGP